MTGRGEPPLASACEREPIHIPGSIQACGVLLVLRPDSLRIMQVSENVQALFGLTPEQVLGGSVRTLLGGEATDQLAAALSADAVEQLGPLDIERDHQRMIAHAHVHEGVLLVEVETVSEARCEPSWQGDVRLALKRLHGARSIGALCDIVVREVRRLTGFERVIVYRFDDDGNGNVIAEERSSDDVESFLGQHFPASDIPQQARALYRKNWIRLIPDATRRPVAVVPPARPDTGAPLDLSLAMLRAVSPVHCEYMANMGVQASMSLSLVHGTKLWGLVTCGHRTPRMVPFDVRAVCELLARMTSLQIEAFEALSHGRLRERRNDALDALNGAMRQAQGEVLSGLLRRPEALLDLADAHGAVVWADGFRGATGVTPPPDVVARVVEWLAATTDREVVSTVSLGKLLPAVVAHAEEASGLLALTLPKPGSHHVLWFRPEEVRTVAWGGDPEKSVDSDGGRVHPRRSFALWTEVVRGNSLAWKSGELELARDLRRFAVEIDLARQVVKEQRIIAARDDLLAIVSHDLRSPLGVVQMQAEWLRMSLQRTVSKGQLRIASDRIQRSAHQMRVLIDDLLDLAKIEGGQFVVEPRPEPLRPLVEDVVVASVPLANAKSIALELEPEVSSVVVWADRDRLQRVLSNLVGNAIKFTPHGGQIRIAAQQSDGVVTVQVSDTGKGIAPEHLVHLFDRYWRAQRTATEGTGLGLYIAKGIVDAHGGQMSVCSELGSGTTVTFSLPSHEAERG